MWEARLWSRKCDVVIRILVEESRDAVVMAILILADAVFENIANCLAVFVPAALFGLVVSGKHGLLFV